LPPASRLYGLDHNIPPSSRATVRLTRVPVFHGLQIDRGATAKAIVIAGCAFGVLRAASGMW